MFAKDSVKFLSTHKKSLQKSGSINMETQLKTEMILLHSGCFPHSRIQSRLFLTLDGKHTMYYYL